MSPSPLGSGVLPPGPPTWRGRLQVRRCDSRRSLGLEPFVSPQLRESRKRLRPPLLSFPERSPARTRPVAGAESAARPGVRESWARGAVRPAGPSARLPCLPQQPRPGSQIPAPAGEGRTLPAHPGPTPRRSAYSSPCSGWEASGVRRFRSKRQGVPEAPLPLIPLGSGVQEVRGGVADRGILGAGVRRRGSLSASHRFWA